MTTRPRAVGRRGPPVFRRAIAARRSRERRARAFLWIAASPFGLLAMTDKGARLGRCDRPGNPPQRPEKVESAPGIATAAAVAARSGGLRGATRRGAPQSEGEALPLAASPGDSRPENPPQHLEKVDSAPGIATAAAVAARSGRLRGGATRRDAFPSRAKRFRSPPRQATAARKIRRNALKRLIPRPGSRQPTASPCGQAGFATRGVGARLNPRAERLRWPPREPTIARKFRRNTLKRLKSALRDRDSRQRRRAVRRPSRREASGAVSPLQAVSRLVSCSERMAQRQPGLRGGGPKRITKKALSIWT